MDIIVKEKRNSKRERKQIQKKTRDVVVRYDITDNNRYMRMWQKPQRRVHKHEHEHEHEHKQEQEHEHEHEQGHEQGHEREREYYIHTYIYIYMPQITLVIY